MHWLSLSFLSCVSPLYHLILFKQDDLPGSHGGIVRVFGQLYVKNSELDKVIGREFDKLLPLLVAFGQYLKEYATDKFWMSHQVQIINRFGTNVPFFLDNEIVFGIFKNRLSDFQLFVERITQYLERSD